MDARTVDVLVGHIKPLLAGLAPDVQAGVIADLTAIWLAGHPPAIREALLALHVATVEQLVEPNEKQMFGEAGHPAGRN